MKMAIETVELGNEDGLFDYAECKVRAALRPVASRVKVVRVQVRDVNGPDVGGVDKHCIVSVSLHALGSHVFDEVHTDARAAVELVAARVNGWAQRRAELLKRPRP